MDTANTNVKMATSVCQNILRAFLITFPYLIVQLANLVKISVKFRIFVA
jgi:hypothetical protein